MDIEQIRGDIKSIKRRFDDRNETRFRMDKKNNKETDGVGGKGTGGNTRLPYGIAKGKGIETEGMTPSEVWEKLKGEGVSPEKAYEALEKGKAGEEVGEYATVEEKNVETVEEENESGVNESTSPVDTNESDPDDTDSDKLISEEYIENEEEKDIDGNEGHITGNDVSTEMLDSLPVNSTISNGVYSYTKGENGDWYGSDDALMEDAYDVQDIIDYFNYVTGDGELTVTGGELAENNTEDEPDIDTETVENGNTEPEIEQGSQQKNTVKVNGSDITGKQLDDLPVGSKVTNGGSVQFIKFSDGEWVMNGFPSVKYSSDGLSESMHDIFSNDEMTIESSGPQTVNAGGQKNNTAETEEDDGTVSNTLSKNGWKKTEDGCLEIQKAKKGVNFSKENLLDLPDKSEITVDFGDVSFKFIKDGDTWTEGLHGKHVGYTSLEIQMDGSHVTVKENKVAAVKVDETAYVNPKWGEPDYYGAFTADGNSISENDINSLAIGSEMIFPKYCTKYVKKEDGWYLNDGYGDCNGPVSDEFVKNECENEKIKIKSKPGGKPYVSTTEEDPVVSKLTQKGWNKTEDGHYEVNKAKHGVNFSTEDLQELPDKSEVVVQTTGNDSLLFIKNGSTWTLNGFSGIYVDSQVAYQMNDEHVSIKVASGSKAEPKNETYHVNGIDITKDELDSLPSGSKIKVGTLEYVKESDGDWTMNGFVTYASWKVESQMQWQHGGEDITIEKAASKNKAFGNGKKDISELVNPNWGKCGNGKYSLAGSEITKEDADKFPVGTTVGVEGYGEFVKEQNGTWTLTDSSGDSYTGKKGDFMALLVNANLPDNEEISVNIPGYEHEKANIVKKSPVEKVEKHYSNSKWKSNGGNKYAALGCELTKHDLKEMGEGSTVEYNGMNGNGKFTKDDKGKWTDENGKKVSLSSVISSIGGEDWLTITSEKKKDYDGPTHYTKKTWKNIDGNKYETVAKNVKMSDLNGLGKGSKITFENGQFAQKVDVGKWIIKDDEDDQFPMDTDQEDLKYLFETDKNVTITSADKPNLLKKAGSKKNPGETFNADFDSLSKNSVVYHSKYDSYNEFFDRTSDQWLQSSQEERDSIYDYTCGPGHINATLRSYYEKGKYYNDRNLNSPKIKKEIEHMTNMLDRCVLPNDIKLVRGAELGVAAEMLGISENQLYTMNPEDLIGMTGQEKAFMSCGTSEGTGFNKDVKLEIYCPAGTKGMYIEPFSHYGLTNTTGDWDGKQKSTEVRNENETLLQRGTKVKVCGASKDKYGYLHLTLMVIGQSQDYDFPDETKKKSGSSWSW